MLDTSWANTEQAAADAIEVLRFAPGDLDEQRVQRKARVAAGLIAQHLDRKVDDEGDPIPITDPVELELLHDAHGQLTTELYLRKDAAFGVMNAYSEDQAYRIGSDPLAGIRSMLIGSKQQWGIA